MGRRAWIALATAALLHTFAAPGAAAPPMVTAVELSSSHPLPEQQVRAVIGDLTGKPLSRDAVRDALERLWGLGLFSAIRVDEIPTPGGGVRLRYELTQRSLIRKISWEGSRASTSPRWLPSPASPSEKRRPRRDWPGPSGIS